MKSGPTSSILPAEGTGGIDVRGLLWLLSLSLTLIVILLPFSSYVAALPYIQDEWGLNNSQAGAVFSFYLAGYAISALLVIPLTDRLGAKYIFLGSALVSMAAHWLFPLVADNMASAAALRAVAGLGLVGVYMPGLRIIGERFDARGRGMAMGIYVTCYYLAGSLSLAATGGIMTWLEWRDAYAVIALAAFGGLPPAFLLLRGHVHSSSAGSSGVLDLGVLRNRSTRYLTLGYSLHAFELYSVRIWLPALLTAVLMAKGVESARAVVAAATVGGLALAVGSVGPALGGAVSDRWGRASSAAAIFAISGACSLAIGWIGDLGLPWMAIISLTMVYGLAVAADSAIYTTGIVERADPDSLGSTLAVQSFIGFSGGVAGPIVMGGILDVAPESIKWGVAFSFLGVVAVSAVAALVRLHRAEGTRTGLEVGDQT